MNTPEHNGSSADTTPESVKDLFEGIIKAEFDVDLSAPAGNNEIVATQETVSLTPEQPFGEGFLRSLPIYDGRKPRDPTPAPVTITGKDAEGNITEVSTGSPD